MASHTVTIDGEASFADKKLQCQKAAEDLQIKYISIVGESFGNDDSGILKRILKLISMEGRKWNGIKLLNCTGDLGMVVDAVLKTKVRKLVIKDATSHVLSSLGKGLASNSSLLILELHDMTLNGSDIRSLFDSLSKSPIMELHLDNSTFVGDAHIAFGDGLRVAESMQSLSLKGCGLRDEQCEVINNSLVDHKSLLELNFEGNSCINEGMNALSRVMKTTNLLVLDMGAQQFSDSQTIQLKAFADALEVAPIRYVQLSDNRIDETNMSELFRGVGTTSSIEILNVSWCSVSTKSLGALANALGQTSSIRSVNLFGCGIDDNGVKQMAKSLHAWKIKKLDLGGRQSYTEEGISELMSQLQDNMYLEEILLNTTTCITNRFFLDVNRGGRKFVLYKDQAPVGLWPNLLHRAQKVPLPRTSDLWLSNLTAETEKKTTSKELESDESRRASVLFHLLRDGLIPSI
ncbi:unnamed protein product [Cylindrotheca closterium]|uniref:Uncharacterized protein n=1 Tax=Cylindrotheca closterium TaxID=2856 RepID=A0AAD2FPN6_9STRA|nr:unnamed protein product [Cylindrotheca closterium]